MPELIPTILPLGDRALLLRFGSSLSEAANSAALAAAGRLEAAGLPGVSEVAPSLVSVLLRYDPQVISFDHLAGEVRLLAVAAPKLDQGVEHRIEVRFAGDDLETVAGALGMTAETFVSAHNAAPLRVLAVGFAPGFVYCGFHPAGLHLPRRSEVRRRVPAGTVLFAAGQTAITSTDIPTGWHVIGRTALRNFDATAMPPTRLRAGDRVQFEAVA